MVPTPWELSFGNDQSILQDITRDLAPRAHPETSALVPTTSAFRIPCTLSYRAPTNSSQGGRRRQRCTVSKGPKLSVRYSTLSEQLWSKSTLGATLERTPPVKAPGPMGPPEPPEPAIPGSGRIGHQVAGFTATAWAEPKDHTSQRALRPWCSTSGQLVGPPDKPRAPQRAIKEPGGGASRIIICRARHILESILAKSWHGFPLSRNAVWP